MSRENGAVVGEKHVRSLWSWDPDVDLAWALGRRPSAGGGRGDEFPSALPGWRRWIARLRRTDSDPVTGQEP